MPVYGLVWLQISREHYASLPSAVREQVDARLDQLRENPRPSDADYDERTDQWITTYGAGAGMILYAVVPEHERMIILRLV